MFSVQRFDGGAGPSSQPQARGGQQAANPLRPPVDRIALLNAKRAKQGGEQGINGGGGGASTPDSANATTTATTTAAASISHIHPSRLAQSQVLRQSDKKIRNSLQPGNKDKTKAKQRYLNRKKERRKNREKTKKIKTKAAAKRVDGGEAEHLEDGDAPIQQTRTIDAEEATSSDDDGSSSSSNDAKNTAAAQNQNHAKQLDERSTSSSAEATSDSEPETEDEPDIRPRTSKDIEDAEQHALAAEANADASSAVESHHDGLQRFPAPRATRLASRKDLAAQGLPEGLARPQYVKPSLSATVQKSDTRALDMISGTMKERLAKLGIKEWFAVQTAIIPLLLDNPHSFSLYPAPPLNDVCVSAPTGSGKTLSYAVPIVEVLSRRIHKRLRALVLVPTRDLVHQVRETITALSRGTGLTIASLTGQQSFSHEQAQLVDMRNMPARRNIPGLKTLVPGSQEEAEVFAMQRKIMSGAGQMPLSADEVPPASADIVIATPGRLIDHLDQTPGFTLQHLRYLVIDEADRLLSQSFQEWLPRILAALDPKKGAQAAIGERHSREAMAPSWLAQRQILEAERNFGADVISAQRLTALVPPRESSVQKLLFSATLTRDPARIVALELRDAAFISVEGDEKRPSTKHARDEDDDGGTGVRGQADDEEDDSPRDWQESFALPASLSEHMVVVAPQEKPLHLLYLLSTRESPLRQVLCFTKSLESAARLVKLLDFFQEVRARSTSNRHQSFVAKEYSSEQSAGERARLLEAFARQEIDILVCSDVMARGIDLPSVRHVVSYDVPLHMTSYVHRVGRTARAGRQGDAWTLVETHEARHFTLMMRRAQRWDRIVKERRVKPMAAAASTKSDAEGDHHGGARAVQDSADPRYAELENDYKTALRRLEKLYSRKRRAL